MTANSKLQAASFLLPRLVLASRNAGKVIEVREYLGDLVGEILTPADFPEAGPEPEETGETYLDNALLKARQLFEATGLPVLADDSGLEVRALGNRPGVHSKRYGEGDAERIRKLLAELEGVSDAARQARFVCALALLRAGAPPLTVTGICEGRILRAPRGTNGFGFDPIFHPDATARPMAELTTEEKNRISHRGRALRELARRLRG